MAIQPRTVSVDVEIQGTAMSIRDLRDTVRSVVQGAVDGMVRTVHVSVRQPTKRAKKAKR